MNRDCHLSAQAEKDVGQLVTSFGRGFTVLEKELECDLTGEEKVHLFLQNCSDLSFSILMTLR